MKSFIVDMSLSNDALNKFVENIKEQYYHFTLKYYYTPDCIYVNWEKYKQLSIYLKHIKHGHSEYYGQDMLNSDLYCIGLKLIPIPIDNDYIEVGFEEKDKMIDYKLCRNNKEE